MFPTFRSQSRKFFGGSERKNLPKNTDMNNTLIKIQDMCHFFLLARVKCEYSYVSNVLSSWLSGSLAQLISQASRIFLCYQLLLDGEFWPHPTRYHDLFLSRGPQVLIFRLAAARQPFDARLSLLWIFSAFRQYSSCCNQRKECCKQDHGFLLCPIGLSGLERSGLMSDTV